jgi:uncharacterized protein (TIGR02118 family)
MIKVGVYYPYSGGAPFDMTYYLEKHMPMVRQKLGAALKSMSVEHGLQGMADPSSAGPPTYVVMAHLGFDSVEAFQAAFGAHAQAIMADVANYTKIVPILQISEVKM